MLVADVVNARDVNANICDMAANAPGVRPRSLDRMLRRAHADPADNMSFPIILIAEVE
jgi:hypothetical protein